jgi:hypothetical protein
MIHSLCLVSLAIPAQAADEWILEQTSPDSGTHTVYVSTSAVKIVNAESSVVILLKKPNWDVTVFNQKAKTIFQGPLANWHGYRGVAEHAFFAARFSGLVKTGEKPKQLNGLNCIEQQYESNVASVPAGSRNVDIRIMHVTSETQFHLPPAVCKVVSQEYYLPPTAGLPLLASYVSATKTNHAELRLTGCEKLAYKASDFVAPAGYTKVLSADQVMKAKDEKMIDFFEMIK